MFLKKNYLKNAIFRKLILSYIMVLVIPIIIGGYVYNQLTHIVEQDAKNRNVALLDQAKDMLDARLVEANSLAQKIIFYPEVNSLINSELNNIQLNYYDIWDFNRQMNKFNLNNDFIKNYYIFIKKSDLVISSNTIYNNIEVFNKKHLEFRNIQLNDSKIMWNQFYSQNYIPATFTSDENKVHPVIMLLQTVPIKISGEYQGLVMVMLDEQRILNFLSNIEIGETGMTYIIDNSSNVITSIYGRNSNIRPSDIQLNESGYSFVDKTKDKSFLISSIVSDKTQWRLVLKERDITANIRSQRKLRVDVPVY